MPDGLLAEARRALHFPRQRREKQSEAALTHQAPASTGHPSMIGELIKIKPEQLSPKGGKRRKKPLLKRRWVHVLLVLMLLTALGGWLGLKAYLKPFEEKAATYDMALVAQLEQSSIIYDRSRAEIGRLANENRVIIPFSDMPAHLIDALIATEDQRYWKHEGVDGWGIARAAWTNLKAGEMKQGASTITMQLARTTYGHTEITRERKILEMFLALRIFKHYSRSQILELYFNRIPLGKGFYGIEAAAQGYFSKPAKELTKSEAAVIVGLIKSPRYYNPFNSLPLATRERNKVFDRMVAEEKMTEEEAEKLKKEPIALKPSETARATGYVQREVEDEVETILAGMGIEGITGKGYKIFTTLDSALQQAAEQSLARRLTEIENSQGYPAREKMSDYTKKLAEYAAKLEAHQKGTGPAPPEKPLPTYLQGALLAVDNRTGGVLAMCGGRDYGQSQFNRVLLSKRPAGTAFVPFVYAAAYAGTHFPGSRIVDQRMDNTKVMMGAVTGTLGEWGMEVTEGAHEGMTSLRSALIQGKNNCAARLGLDIGVKKVTDLAQRAGLGEMAEDPTTLLGRAEVSLRDLTLAYSIFPNAGAKPEGIWYVTRIEKPDGTAIYDRPAAAKLTPVTDPVAAWMTHSCLEDAVFSDLGTASNYHRYGPAMKDLHVAGKTGTHINSTDLWFAGYSKDVTCAVWVGLDKKEPVYPDAFSRHTALPVWVDMMLAAAAKKAPDALEEPAGMQLVELCAESGELATDACLETGPDPSDPARQKLIKCSYMEFIRPGSKWELRCTYHNKPELATNSTAPVNPQALTNGSTDPGMDNRALPLTVPVVIGDDPYSSHSGARPDQGASGTTGPPAISPTDSTAPPLIPAAPVPNAGNSTLLNPSPGKAEVD